MLGGIGYLGIFFFYEIKNIIVGEGGMLVVNDECFIVCLEIIWEKGINCFVFFCGEIDKYGWVDVGSFFLLSEVIVVFLFV